MAVLLLNFLSLSILFFFPFFLLALFNRFRKFWVDGPNLPPSPSKLPIIGNLHQLGRLPHRSLRDLSKKYGPLMLLHLGQSPTLVVSSAKVVQEIVKSHDLGFSGRPSLKVANQHLYGCNDVVFSPYGEFWRGAKKVCVVELLSTRRVQSFHHVREEEVHIMVKNISKCSPKKAVNLSEMLMDLTNNIITRIAFGTKFGKDGENKYTGMIRELGTLLGLFCVGDYFPSLGWIDVLTGLDKRTKMNFRGLDAVFDQMIEDHLNPERHEKSMVKDFLDVLLQIQKECDPEDTPLSKENLKGIILDMFAAGTETTSIALDWAMAELMRNPTILKTAQDEVRGVVGEKKNVEEEDIKEMNYLKSIIKETLRLHPPLPLLAPRETISATQLQGYNIPAKCRVIINAWAIARDTDYWENAEEFCPDRFINNPVDFKGKDFQFITFGVGRRGCPGISFATVSMELILANLLYWFDWQLPDGDKDLDLTEGSGLTVHRKHDLHLVPISKVSMR